VTGARETGTGTPRWWWTGSNDDRGLAGVAGWADSTGEEHGPGEWAESGPPSLPLATPRREPLEEPAAICRPAACTTVGTAQRRADRNTFATFSGPSTLAVVWLTRKKKYLESDRRTVTSFEHPGVYDRTPTRRGSDLATSTRILGAVTVVTLAVLFGNVPSASGTQTAACRRASILSSSSRPIPLSITQLANFQCTQGSQAAETVSDVTPDHTACSEYNLARRQGADALTLDNRMARCVASWVNFANGGGNSSTSGQTYSTHSWEYRNMGWILLAIATTAVLGPRARRAGHPKCEQCDGSRYIVHGANPAPASYKCPECHGRGWI